jgi:hypothetical protein
MVSCSNTIFMGDCLLLLFVLDLNLLESAILINLTITSLLFIGFCLPVCHSNLQRSKWYRIHAPGTSE